MWQGISASHSQAEALKEEAHSVCRYWQSGWQQLTAVTGCVKKSWPYRDGSLQLFAKLQLSLKDLCLLFNGRLHLLTVIKATLQSEPTGLLVLSCCAPKK